MNVINALRKKAFWTIDAIKGGEVRRNLSEIEQILNEPSGNEVEKYKNRILDELLNHAVKNSKFYYRYFDFKSINDFPIIDKFVIKNNLDSLIAKAFKKEKLHKVSTSGSTGTPFEMFQCSTKKNRNIADNLFFMNEAGYEIGDKLYFLRIWNKINRIGIFKRTSQNIVMVNASDLSSAFARELLQKIEREKEPITLLAYGSTYEALTREFNQSGKHKLEGKIKAVLVMSESVSEDTRAFLAQFFGCPVFSRYSNAENGFLAHQFDSIDNSYLINDASYFIEFLKLDSDSCADEGEFARVVITDLFNYAVPIIRYDTGDIAKFGYSVRNNKKIKVIKNIEGRKLDFVFDSKGNLISPHVIDYAVRKFEEIIQFQFIQKDKNHYLIKLNTIGENIDDKIRNALSVYLGFDAKIDTEYVDEIPLLSSGKRKMVINEMNVNQKVLS